MQKNLNGMQARKYQLTVNHPEEKGLTHDVIKELIANGLKSTVYYCMADEIGESGTPHTHIYMVFSSPVRFSTIKNLFPAAHIEKALGSSEENRNYILKAGKWENSEKHGTSIDGSFEEWGEIGQERQGAKKADLEEIYNMLKAGASDYDIFERNPGNIRYVAHIEKVRQTLAKEEIRNRYRPLTVTYIQGPPGVGKSRYVLDTYGYDQTYRATDYKHPFDNYVGEEVLVFEEFKDSLPIRSMLLYLEGYPQQLPARYSNKWASYTKVYIISNTPLEEQYRDAQYNEADVWKAFLRRIHKVMEFLDDGTQVEYTVEEYFGDAMKLPDVSAAAFPSE